MKAKGTVLNIIDETHATVRTVRKSACEECHKNSDKGCRACDVFFGSDTIETSVLNKLNAKPGDEVIIESSSSYIILTAAIVFLIPVVLAVIGYVIGQFVLKLTDISPLFALLGFIIGTASAIVYGNINKSKERIEITEILNKEE